ncbi:MAG: methylenetetrahydrofolate reductase [Elusimicrobiota bacterium]|nr:methylenetetrahydrofolate reductase [Elusimicrobiota bacterium]
MKFKDKLKSNKFLITAELFPPKGTDISFFSKRADCLLNSGVDAVNVTDNQRASMRTSSLAMCKILADKGIEPILQLTARDRNRIALQSDLLGASVLGIENVLILSGDHPKFGDYANAKAVYDLDTIQLIKTTKMLGSGFDLAGKKLCGSPNFCVGAVVNPTAYPNEMQVLMFEKKIKAGAEFFQTQTVFDVEIFKAFYDKVKSFGVKVLAGVMLIKSAKSLSFFQNLPGVTVPKEIQKKIASSSVALKDGIDICAQTIKQLRQFADGVHIMSIGMEELIPEIINKS